MSTKTLVITALLACACNAFSQVATVSDPAMQGYGLAARGGQHFGFAGTARPIDQLGLTVRAAGSAWDAGAEYRALRVESDRGGSALMFDLGGTVLYGSRGAKAAAEAGAVLGDSSDLFFWAKGTVGNFRTIAGGLQLGRLSLSGARGNYFENRADLGVRVDRAGKYVVSAGWSSAIGFNAGLHYSWTFKR